MSKRRWLRPQARINYFEPEEPDLDEYVFCDKCGDYVYEYCSIHGSLLVIPDDKVPAKHNFPSYVPRAALTIPKVFLHLNYSSIPGAGLGVFTTLTLPKGVRFGPYRGVKTKEITSDYSWQIYDRNRKPCHVVDAADGNKSNWMRFVNCSRHWFEQNLVAYQYQGELYYRTIKIIPRFTELMVFYGSEFANKLHIDLGKYNAPKSYAEKFGARLIKKPKTSPENKKRPDESVSPMIEKEGKEIKQQITLKPTASAQEMKNIKKRQSVTQKEAPADKKRKTKVENKKLQPEKFDIETVERNTNSHQGISKEHAIKPSELEVKEQKNKETDVNSKMKTSKSNDEELHLRNELLKNIATKVPDTESKKQNMNLNIHDVYFICNECNYQSVTKDILKRHMRFHDVNRKFACQTCGYRFSANASLNRHKLSHKTNISTAKIHESNICEFTTIRSSSLKTHLRTHTETKPYICNICGYKTIYVGNLKSHTRIHTKEKPYVCDICNVKFTQASNLKSHTRIHTKEKPYVCDICNVKFTQASHLKSHTRIHTKEKPYVCDICNVKFTRASSLKSHTRIHTKEKPYVCDICNVKFTQASNLKSHTRIHTKEKPYVCDICNVKFAHASSLKNHTRTHTGEKPYSCDICEYKCIQTSDLKKHLKNKHLN